MPARSEASQTTQPAGGGLREQRPVDEQRRHQRLGLGRRQPEALDQLVLVEPLDLVAEREEPLAGDLARAALGVGVEDLRRGEAHVAADRDDVRDPVERDLDADFLDDVRDVAAEQRHLDVVAVALQVELLAHADRAERVDAGAGRLAAPQQRQAGAAAADLGQQRPRAAERRVVLERVAHREVQQPALFRLVDDVELDAGAPPDAIEEHVAVPGLADGAGRHGADLADAVQVHRLAEAVERADHRVAGARPDGPAGREGVAAERDAARRLLDHPRRLAGPDLGDRQPDGAGAHVEHGDQEQVCPRRPPLPPTDSRWSTSSRMILDRRVGDRKSKRDVTA